uniref:Uncharacterized protein n=1 Tax=Anguilla anguilla TaxID=7936 RepID=A0A0E9QWA3_ANGAN
MFEHPKGKNGFDFFKFSPETGS